MKYIRTKDGRIVEFAICQELIVNDVKGLYISKDLNHDFIRLDNIIKQADTIEELCDKFVIYVKEQNDGLPMICPKERLNEMKSYIQIGMQKQFNCWLKGATWTDKGLIYVAKMNESGVLELL